MQVKFDKATKTVTLTFHYDPTAEYPVNAKSGKSRTVGGTGGFSTVDGAPGLKVNVNAILPVDHVPSK